MGFIEDLKRSARQQGAPVTVALMAGFVAMALVLFLAHASGSPLAFSPNWFSQPWSVLTYPFAMSWLTSGNGLIALLFTVYWLFWVGGSMEREVGSQKFAIVWVLSTILPALFLWSGMELLRMPATLNTPMLPISALTVAWGFRNTTASVRLLMILPITGFWLAWLTVGICFFNYATPFPLLGIFAVLHLAIAWAFAQNRIPAFLYSRPVVHYKPSRGQQRRDDQYFEDVRKREKEREERERLRKLFENSLIDEDAS